MSSPSIQPAQKTIGSRPSSWVSRAERKVQNATAETSTANSATAALSERRLTARTIPASARRASPRLAILPQTSRYQIDHRSEHTATQPDRTGRFLAPAERGWPGVAAHFDSDWV